MIPPSLVSAMGSGLTMTRPGAALSLGGSGLGFGTSITTLGFAMGGSPKWGLIVSVNRFRLVVRLVRRVAFPDLGVDSLVEGPGVAAGGGHGRRGAELD